MILSLLMGSSALLAAPQHPLPELPAAQDMCGSDSDAAQWFSENPPVSSTAAPPTSTSKLEFRWSLSRHGDVFVMQDMSGEDYPHGGLGYQAMYSAISEFYQRVPDSFDFLTVLTDAESGNSMGALGFYSPLANDAKGIGDRIYDSDMQLQGLLFMNTWQYWTQNETWTSGVFGQELGHRWGSYVNYDLGEGEGVQDDILGRSDGHWSYWLNMGNSPMEGNFWEDNQDGTFSVDPHEDVAYSDLDLYLMGLLPADQVAPFFLIQEPEGLKRNASSPPEYFSTGQSVTTNGRRLDLSIDDVIRAEGPRDPAAGVAQSEFNMAIVLVLATDERASPTNVRGVQDVAERFSTVWREDTRELGVLNIDSAELELPAPTSELFTMVDTIPTRAW